MADSISLEFLHEHLRGGDTARGRGDYIHRASVAFTARARGESEVVNRILDHHSQHEMHVTTCVMIDDYFLRAEGRVTGEAPITSKLHVGGADGTEEVDLSTIVAIVNDACDVANLPEPDFIAFESACAPRMDHGTDADEGLREYFNKVCGLRKEAASIQDGWFVSPPVRPGRHPIHLAVQLWDCDSCRAGFSREPASAARTCDAPSDCMQAGESRRRARRWACPTLAFWWQLTRLKAAVEADLPHLHHNSAAAKANEKTFAADRTITVLKPSFIGVEHAVRGLLQLRDPELVERVSYVMMPDGASM